MDLEPVNPNDLAEGVSDIGTARLALRWALERIRSLESADKTTLELQEQARAAKECAQVELEEARRSIAKSMSELTVKEQFVTEMRQILASHFSGEADAKRSLDQRQKLEGELTNIREAANRRIEKAETAARGTVAEVAKRLAEAEKDFRAALDEAWRQHREDLEAKQTMASQLSLKDDQVRALEERRTREFEALRAENRQLEQAYAAEETRRAMEAAERMSVLLQHQKAELVDLHEERERFQEEARRESESLHGQMSSLEQEGVARLKALEKQHAAEQRRRSQETTELMGIREGRQEAELKSLHEEHQRLQEEARREFESLHAQLHDQHQEGVEQLKAAAESYAAADLLRARDDAERAQLLEERHRRELEELRSEARRTEQALSEQERRRAAAATELLKKVEERKHDEIKSVQVGHQVELEVERDYRRDLEALNQSLTALAERRQQELGALKATSPAPPPPSKRRYAALAAIAACAIAAWLAVISGKEHGIPTAHPSALVWKDDLLWVSDWHAQAVYSLRQQSSGLKVVRRYELPGSHIVGLALSSDRMFVLDSWSRKISRRRLDEKLTLEAAVSSPGPKPSALFFDGQYLWSADLDLHRIYQHANDASLTVLSSYAVPHAPVALNSDAAGFWTVDAQSVAFFRHQPPPNLSVEGEYRLREAADDGRPISAFTLREGRFWIAKDGSNKLLERPLWRLSKQPRDH